MPKSTKPQIVKALHDAVREVEGQHVDEHARMMASGTLPGWLTTVLQVVISESPAVLAALQRWIAGQGAGPRRPPAPPPPASDVAPGTPGVPANQPPGA